MFNRATLFMLLTLIFVTDSHAGWGNMDGRGPVSQSPDQSGWQDPNQAELQNPDPTQDQNISEELSVKEAEQLTYLLEEEKVARDVYLLMNQRWNLYVFSNISNAEQNHMSSTLNKLNQYGLTDPSLDQIGLFSNPELQELFDTLIAKANESEIDALLTGALIEEVDMQDLNEMIASTDKADLISMYEKLHCGSRNHLRAFVSQIESHGLVYSAQVMSQDVVDSIVDTAMERRCGAGGM